MRDLRAEYAAYCKAHFDNGGGAPLAFTAWRDARDEEKCICFPVENPWTYYGAVEPGGALEPNPDCPVYFPAVRDKRNEEGEK